jgi:hypothetical protein
MRDVRVVRKTSRESGGGDRQIMSNAMIEQAVNAYLKMDKHAKYRPAAPSDGMGNITVPIENLNLHKEAHTYAERWVEDEDGFNFFIGSGDYQTREALIFTVEAARNLCAGRLGDHVALKLLKLAIKEVEAVIEKNEKNESRTIYENLGVGR